MRIRNVLALAMSGCMATAAIAGDPVKNYDGTAKADAPQTLPAGVTPKDLNDKQDVRAVLAAATNAAVTKGGFDDMVERLSSKDRERFGDFADREFTEIDGRIEQIRKNWEQKYGSSFDLNNDKYFENFVRVAEGEVTDAATARQNWPVPARAARDGVKNDVGNNDYIENGRNVALVTVPASHDLPGITVSMIHEPVDDWRMDIPDNVTGQMIHDNLKTALTKMGDNVAAWPADVNEAYRKFGHSILMAVYDVQADDAKSAALDNR